MKGASMLKFFTALLKKSSVPGPEGEKSSMQEIMPDTSKISLSDAGAVWEKINLDYPDSPFDRIRLKLPLAGRVDFERKGFGSEKHRYKLNPPLSLEKVQVWQAEKGVELPVDYVAFITRLGNGGAGPYYGIEPFEKAAADDRSQYPGLPMLLSPSMSPEAWQALSMVPDDISDEDFDARAEKIHQGMFYLGTCGCEYDLMLVLTGPYTGRILYTHDWVDSEALYSFSHEQGFFEWYERWLDEVILGYDTSWFGHRLGGNEVTLLHHYEQALSLDEKMDAINGLSKLPGLSEKGLAFLESLLKIQEPVLSSEALYMLAKFAADRSTVALLEALQSGNSFKRCEAIKTIFYQHKKQFAVFKEAILAVLPDVTDTETIRFSGYVLTELEAVQVECFAHWFCHQEVELVRAAIYAASHDPELQQKVAAFYDSIASDNAHISLTAIQAVSGTKQFYPDMLPYLKAAWQKYPTEKDPYIRSNIRQYLSTAKMDEALNVSQW